MSMRPLLALTAWLCCTTACFSLGKKLDADEAPASLATGQVVKVTDVIKGDEIAVEDGEGHPARVRLLGVLAFADEIQEAELEQWRAAAVGYLAERLEGKKVTLTLGATPRDSSGRYLAYVGLGEDLPDVNASMVAEGYSVVYTEYGFERESEYLAAEAAARVAKKNLWSHDGPARVTAGLRRQWAKFRRERGQAPPPDPLLAP